MVAPKAEDRDPAKTCTARRSNGEPCARYAMRGQKVCAKHGGKSPQALRSARVRLEMAADRMAKELLGIALDPDADANVKLKAIGMALDRAGITTKQTIAIGPDTDAPWMNVLENLMVARTTRDGLPLPPQPSLPGPRNQLAPPMIEGEVVENPRETTNVDVPEAQVASGDAATPTEQPPEQRPPRPEPTAPVRTGLVAIEDALERLTGPYPHNRR